MSISCIPFLKYTKTWARTAVPHALLCANDWNLCADGADAIEREAANSKASMGLDVSGEFIGMGLMA